MDAAPGRYLQRDQPDGRAAARADRRAHAARRAGGELLVSAATSWSTSGSPSGCAGRDVVDMACGEGYGSGVLAAGARRASSASTPTPRPTSTRGCATAAPNLRFERDLVESFSERRATPSSFLQTIEHVRGPGRGARALQVACSRPGGDAYVSTPNVLTLAPRGRREARATRGTCTSTAPRSSAALLRGALLARSSCSACSTRASCAPTSCDAAAGWDRVHPRARLTEPFYDRFTPAIAATRLRAATGEPAALTARWTSSPSAGRDAAGAAGELALVLHTHMPYVEGFGTWPFGEEWLWEAMATVLPAAARRARARRAAHAVADARSSATSSRRPAIARALAALPARRPRARPTRATSRAAARRAPRASPPS